MAAPLFRRRVSRLVKAFFIVLSAVLCALIVAFYIGRSVLADDRLMERWRNAKSETSSEIESSFDRSKEISDYTDWSNALENGGRLFKEGKRREKLMQSLVWLLEHKPGGELTDREKAQLNDVKAALAESEKSDPKETPDDTPDDTLGPAVRAHPAIPAISSDPTPHVTPAYTLSVAFQADVKASQKAAVAKYPALGVAGSPLNQKFVRRYNEWKASKDWHLEHSDWPEVLADECAAHP